MTQQNNSQITEADLQMLLAQNPMAAEQLRRIVAERQRQELQAELDELRATSGSLGVSSNGAEKLDQVPAEA
jgi:hypothetical protein